MLGFDKRVPLTPRARGTDQQLMTDPANRSPATQAVRHELPYERALNIRRFDAPTPEPGSCEPPVSAVSVGHRSSREQPFQAQRSDTVERVEAAITRRPAQLKVRHFAKKCKSAYSECT